MLKFIEGFGAVLMLLTIFALGMGIILGTAFAFDYFLGIWGIPVFIVLFLCVCGGIINATGNDNST